MGEAQKKRIVKLFDSAPEMEEWLNVKSEEGYTLESLVAGEDLVCAVMRLKVDQDSDYGKYMDLMELPIDKVSSDPMGTPMIAKCTGEGWGILNVYKGTKDTPSTALMGRRKQ